VYQEVPAVANFNNVEAEVDAVLAGIGIGQLSLYMIKDALEQGALLPILPQMNTANGALYMYYQQRTQMPLRVRHFIDFVGEAMAAASSKPASPKLKSSPSSKPKSPKPKTISRKEKA
jgi:DNA-binding transcriptional LysR family regulator